MSTSAGVAEGATEDIWNNIKTGLLKTTEEVCGTTRPHRWRRETWWWNEHVEKAIAAKRTAFKAWKAGKGTRASYDAAKQNARHTVHHAPQEADKKVYKNIDPKSSEVYRLANQFRRENIDVVGDKPVKNDAGEMSMSKDSKQKAWLEHYQRLLNIEFDWDPDHLSYQSPVEGPPIPITIDMVKKAISQMKAGKAPGPSGIVVEIWAASDMGASMIRDSAVAIIRDGKVPSDWEQSFIVCLYKGKGTHWKGATTAVSSWQSRLWKSWNWVVDGLIRQLVSIDDSQFGFVPGRGTTDAIFVVRQLQEKYLAANKRLYMTFVDLEKAFDWVPRKVIWWVLRKLGVEEWIVRLVQGMYANARSRVRVGEGYSEEFEVKVGVHQGSVLSPLLFIIVLEALSREFRSGIPWEDLYADDLVIIAESLGECVRRLLTWKEAMEKKGLRVNAGKTKIMICGTGLDLLQSSGEFPCAVCCTGVGSNSIFCNSCKHWVHKKCSGLKRLKKDPDYRCTQCQGTARPLDGRPQKEVQVGPDKLEVVASFCYLGDMLSSRWLWTYNHNTCENRLEEVQGSATSPLFTPPLFQNTWPCVQLLCAECNAPCQQDLAIDKAEPPASAAKWQGNDQTDLQCQATRHCHHQVQWATCAAWHWGSGSHSEGEKTSMVWTCGTLQWCNQDSLWHTGWWKAWAWEAQNDMEAADRKGLQRVEALGYQPSW